MFPLCKTFRSKLALFICMAMGMPLTVGATALPFKRLHLTGHHNRFVSMRQVSPFLRSHGSHRLLVPPGARQGSQLIGWPPQIDDPSKFCMPLGGWEGIERTYKSSGHWRWFRNPCMSYLMLLGSGLGPAVYWHQHRQNVQALGYDEGLYAVHAFEHSIDAFEQEKLAQLPEEDIKELYYATTQLLFDLQAKIIQCKALSKATGYPLSMGDWKRYKQVRSKAENLVRHLCAQNKALDPIGDMQELEDAFFTKTGGDAPEDCLKAFVEGLEGGVVDTPSNLLEGVKSIFNYIGWAVVEIGDELSGHPEARKKIRHHVEEIEAFQQQYAQAGLTQGDQEAGMAQLTSLVLESYNLMYYLNLYKFEFPTLQKELLEKISKARRPLFDEFCLKYDRKWALDRYANQLADMTPAERTQCITYMLTTVVSQAMLMEFIVDIAGLGDLNQLGKRSLLGKWISKTRGGRATFQKLRTLHQSRRSAMHTLLRKGVKASQVRKAVFKQTTTLPKLGVEYFDAPVSTFTPRQLVSYAKEYQERFVAKELGPLTKLQAGLLVKKAEKLGVYVRMDPPHPGTDWNMPHLNVGGKAGTYHVPFNN